MLALVARLRQLAPYALMELMLPGGSVIALLLWFCRTRSRKKSAAAGDITNGSRRIGRRIAQQPNDGFRNFFREPGAAHRRGGGQASCAVRLSAAHMNFSVDEPGTNRVYAHTLRPQFLD
jgi:hypothetical protein